MSQIVQQSDSEKVLAEAGANLGAAYQLIHRSYLAELRQYAVLPPSQSDAINFAMDVRLFRISRLVQDDRQAALESATAAYTTLGAAGFSVFLVADCDGKDTILYIGTRCDAKNGRGEAAGKLLMETFNGHFPGSELEKINGERTQNLLNQSQKIERTQSLAVTAVTGIPALTNDEREHFTQGLERFLDAAENRAYTAIILAEPVAAGNLAIIRTGYEMVGTQIAPLLKTQMSYGVQESEAVGVSLCEGLSTALGESLGLTETRGTTDTHSVSTSKSESTTKDPSQLIGKAGTTGGALTGSAIGTMIGGPLGTIVGGAIGGFVGSFAGPVASATIGSKTIGTSESVSQSTAASFSTSKSTTESKTTTENNSQTESETFTAGTSRQITLDLSNKSIEQLLKKIDHHLERLDEARAYGGWQTAAYFVGETTESAEALGSMFLGLMRGGDSGAEDFALTTWNRQRDKERNKVLGWLSNLSHPRLKPGFANHIGIESVTPAALVSGREMALQLSLPRRSVAAVTVLDVPAYGRRVRLLDLDSGSGQKNVQRQLLLGHIRHLWRDGAQELRLDLDKLCYHTLVTGTTGVGKTTAIMSLLAQTHKMGVPFLAIEPAKGEYKKLLGLATAEKPVTYRVAGRTGADALRINPLVFPQGIELADHIDRICTVFNAAFPMYAAMPQVLEEAIFAAYEELGWDSVSSRCVGPQRRYPTLRRVADLIPEVVKGLGYSEQLSSDYVGALSTRLRSLCRGSLGMTLLCSAEEETSRQQLFETSAVVDLSPMGSPEKRALLMGMLFMRLCEYRMADGLPRDAALRHLMVLEEAHVLLKRTATEQNQESSNPRGLAVEAFANALAEMRAYGQGFIVADQSASALDDCVLRNTNTKIVMRAPFEQDRITLGGALALDEEQTNQLARLENQTAVIHQSNWLEPVLCRIKRVEIPELLPRAAIPESDIQRTAKTRLLLGLWGDRLPVEEPLPDFDQNASMEASADQLGLDRDVAEELLRVCTSAGPRELRSIKPFMPIIFPELDDTAFNSMTLSFQAQLNRIVAMLEQQTLFQADRLALAIAGDIMKCGENVNMEAINAHLELTARRF